MNTLGNECDRDTCRDPDYRKAGQQPQRDATGPPRTGEHNRKRRDRCGVPTGKSQVSISQPPHQWLEHYFGDDDSSHGAANNEQHARPTPGESGHGHCCGKDHRDMVGVCQADQDSSDALIRAQMDHYISI